MELLDLGSKDLWKPCLVTEIRNLEREKSTLLLKDMITAFKSLQKTDEIICKAWKSLTDSYNELKKLIFGVSIFTSVYIREQIFFNMNLMKNKLRNQIIDENLGSCVKLRTRYTPNIIKLSKEMQAKCSH